MKRFVTLILTIFLLISSLGLVACQHEHAFNQKSTKAIYRKSIATCGASAVYYYSCSCGEKGTETFDAGRALGHSYVNRECIRCHDILLTSEGLIFKSTTEDTCFVYSLGICTDKDVVIPSTYDDKIVTGINIDVFKGYTDLESVKIPSTVKTIGQYAFSGCTNLKEVIFDGESQLETIGEGAFEYCYNLEEIAIPNGVTTINRLTFSNCLNLKEVTLPSSLKTINTEAFIRCINLESLTLPNTLETINENAFAQCSSIQTLSIPSSVSFIGVGAFSGCTAITAIQLDNNQNFAVIDGSLYSADEKTLLQYALGKNQTSFVVPDGVKTIDEKAFAYATNLVSITLPTSLDTIGIDAFTCCDNLFVIYNLSGLNIQKGSTQNGGVGYKAREIYNSLAQTSNINIADNFIIYENGQEKLLLGYLGTQTTLTIPNGVTKIESGAFENNMDIQNVVIPNSATKIGEFAFAYCTKLTSVTIGTSVTSIEMGAFLGCSRLSTINYAGTTAEWEEIEKGDSWSFSTGSFKVICSDTPNQ